MKCKKSPKVFPSLDFVSFHKREPTIWLIFLPSRGFPKMHVYKKHTKRQDFFVLKRFYYLLDRTLLLPFNFIFFAFPHPLPLTYSSISCRKDHMYEEKIIITSWIYLTPIFFPPHSIPCSWIFTKCIFTKKDMLKNSRGGQKKRRRGWRG